MINFSFMLRDPPWETSPFISWTLRFDLISQQPSWYSLLIKEHRGLCLTHGFCVFLTHFWAVWILSFTSGLAQYFLFHFSTLYKTQTISLIDGKGATGKAGVCINTYWKPDWQKNKFLFHLNQQLDLFTNISFTHNILMTVRLGISAIP